MRRITFLLLALVLVVGAIGALSLMELRAEPVAPTYVTIANLNLRSAPSTDASSYGIVPRGTRVYFIATVNEEWSRVRTASDTRTVEYNEPIGDQIGYMSREFLRASLPPVQISDFGRQVAEEFLSSDRFAPLFMTVGSMGHSGEIYGWREDIGNWGPLDEVPDFYWNYHYSSYFDRYGNMIAGTPWDDGDHFPARFRLYDFDNTGVPDIFIFHSYSITYEGSGDGGSPLFLYRFVSGQYVRVFGGWSFGPVFYMDTQDNLVMFESSIEIPGVYNVVLTETSMIRESLYRIGVDGGYFYVYNLATGDDVDVDDFVNMANRAFGWGTPPEDYIFLLGARNELLIRVPPLIGLEESIRASIIQRQGEVPDEEPEEPEPPSPGQYIHTHAPGYITFTPNPAGLALVTDPVTAQLQIQQVTTQLALQQDASGHSVSGHELNNFTLHIDNLMRRGTTQYVMHHGRFYAHELRQSTNVADEIRHIAEGVLDSSDIGLLRSLRTNINFVSHEGNAINASFPDDVSAIDFDNITIESDIAAVTLNRENIPLGGEISVSPAGTRAESSVDDWPVNENETTSDTNVSIDNRFRAAIDTITDFSSPLAVLTNLWSLVVIVILLVIWLIVAAFKERLRRWVVPTFAVIAIAVNFGLVMLNVDVSEAPAHGNGMQYAENDRDHNETQDHTGAVEVTMSDGMRATLSLPINGANPDFLVVVNENDEIQHSRFNPVTGNIDARIRTGGVYTLRENQVSFNDISGVSQQAQHAIRQLTSREIMRGAAEGYFNPNDPITRTEVAATIVMAFDMLDQSAQSSFSDLDTLQWYYLAIATAEQAGLIAGFEGGVFRGYLDIPKDQLVVMAANTLMERMGYHAPADIESILERFLDRPQLATWSEDGIALASASNVLIYRADSLFAPQSTMTRGDAAVVLYRVFSRVW